MKEGFPAGIDQSAGRHWHIQVAVERKVAVIIKAHQERPAGAWIIVNIAVCASHVPGEVRAGIVAEIECVRLHTHAVSRSVKIDHLARGSPEVKARSRIVQAHTAARADDEL